MKPARPLLVLTVAVLAAHWLALRPDVKAMQPAPVQAHAFVTRTLTKDAPPPPRPITSPPGAKLAATSRTTSVAATGAQTEPEAAPGQRAASSQPAAALETSQGVAAPVIVPPSVRLRYQVEVRRGGLALEARSELYWRQDGENYEARLEVSAPLLRSRTQHSTGRITSDGLAPLRFSDKARGEEAAHFDRDQGKLTFSSNRPEAPLLPGTQDRLSVLVQLGAMFAGAPAKYPAGTRITLQTAGTRDAEPWEFIVEGEEQLQLPGGKLQAIKLTRSPRREYDIKVELWLAPGMDYVPARLRLTQPNGDSVDQQWSSTDRG